MSALHDIAVIFTGLGFNHIAKVQWYLLLVTDCDYSTAQLCHIAILHL